MSISVHKAVPLPRDSPWGLDAIPEGFPFLVIDEESKIVEPVALYLLAAHLKRGPRNWKPHTVTAVAFDLRDWFDYLSHVSWLNPETQELQVGKPWDVAGETDYIMWRDVMQEIISPYTKRPIASRTIARRQANVERFYAYATKLGWYFGEFVRTKVKKGRVTSSSHGLNSFRSSDSSNANGTKSAYRERAEFAEPVRPLTANEWRQLQFALGPLPSEQGDDLRPCRNRLACELSIGTGLRVDEVANLTEFQLRTLYHAWLSGDDEQRESGFFAMRVVKTKRLKPRDVLVPGYLIPALMTYLDDEREHSIKVGQRQAKSTGRKFKRPISLFVNEAQPTQHAGKSVNATSLSWAFNRACLNANITHSVERFDIESGERYRTDLARHSFHSLRHTFAIWTYHWKKENGDAEPWKEIQVLLGHAHLAVTLDTYLKAVEVDKRNAGRAQYAAKRKMGDGNA